MILLSVDEVKTFHTPKCLSGRTLQNTGWYPRV